MRPAAENPTGAHRTFSQLSPAAPLTGLIFFFVTLPFGFWAWRQARRHPILSPLAIGATLASAQWCGFCEVAIGGEEGRAEADCARAELSGSRLAEPAGRAPEAVRSPRCAQGPVCESGRSIDWPIEGSINAYMQARRPPPSGGRRKRNLCAAAWACDVPTRNSLALSFHTIHPNPQKKEKKKKGKKQRKKERKKERKRAAARQSQGRLPPDAWGTLNPRCHRGDWRARPFKTCLE